jgi:hypothetical protein
LNSSFRIFVRALLPTGQEHLPLPLRKLTMSKQRVVLLSLLLVLLSRALSSQAVPSRLHAGPVFDFHAPPGDPYAETIRQDAFASIAEIESFFGAPFPDPIHFHLVPARPEFDQALARFDLGPTQCWMVGMGTADLIVLLSPQAWPKQACEHDPADRQATRRLIAHELIHVYHGQFNAARDFAGMDDLDWLVEGLAVFGSGQLTKDRIEQTRTAAAAGQLPVSLSKVWTGPSRYAFAGSLIRYIDRTWGRPALVRLLKVHTSAQALALLGVSEEKLLAGWRAALALDASPQ